MKKYWRVWITTALLSVQTAFENRVAVFFFTAGKFLRFFLFILFLNLLDTRLTQVVGFDMNQMITFFLVFNLLDLFGQFFFRGIYWFREQVVSGEFDFRLLKPMSSLFQVLTRQTDILDLPLLVLVIVMLWRQDLSIGFVEWLVVLPVVLSAMLLITAVHVLVGALGVLTTEVDNTIMIYRDISQMARFPIDIYSDLIRGVLTFVIPVGIAFTYPAKAMMGMLTVGNVLFAVMISGLVFGLSLVAWNQALKSYSSASS